MDRFKVIHGHNFLLLGLKAPAANGERKAAQGPRSRAAEEVHSTQDQLLEGQFIETVRPAEHDHQKLAQGGLIAARRRKKET